MSRVPIIAVIGDSEVEGGDGRDRFAEDAGRLIIDRGWRVQTGGLGGVMEAASRGGRASHRWVSGCVIGILPGCNPDDANPYVDLALPTGLDHCRNLLVGQADAVIAVGGGAGTLSEIAMAWMMFRLIVARRGEGWAGRLADQRVDERVRYPDISEDRVYGVDTAEEAVATVARWLPEYRRRHGGVRRRDRGPTG
jgi:uncharacterized protein (TIGR00725 family)